jgi:hypothetical protein
LAAQKGAEAVEITRTVAREEEVSGDGATKVAEADMHGYTDGSLEGAADVVPIPGNTLRYIGIYARSEEEATGVPHAVVVRGKEHNKTDDTGASY